MKKLNRFLDELKSGEFSLTKMPYFGGEKPINNTGLKVWSWDETHVIVGDCVESIKIVTRRKI
jgi:hypothetical protein